MGQHSPNERPTNLVHATRANSPFRSSDAPDEGAKQSTMAPSNRFSFKNGKSASRRESPVGNLPVQPAWPGTDALASHWLVRHNFSPVTVEFKLRLLRAAIRGHGLNVEAFFGPDGPKTGDAEARRFLELRLREGLGNEGYNQSLFLIKNLADFAGWKLDIEPKRKATVPNPNPLNTAQIKQLLQVVPKGTEDAVRLKRGLVAWHVYLGLRPTESNNVDLKHLDLADRHNAWVKIAHPGKLGTVRSLALPPGLLHPKSGFGAYLSWRLSLETDEPALWVTKETTAKGSNYKRLSHNKARQFIAQVFRAAGLKGNATRLRHTVGTRIAQGKTSNIFDAAFQLGHRSIETTRRNYAQLTREQQRERTRSVQPDFLRLRDPSEAA